MIQGLVQSLAGTGLLLQRLQGLLQVSVTAGIRQKYVIQGVVQGVV